MAENQGLCPQLATIFILPRKIRLDPREKEVKGTLTVVTAAVQSGLTPKQQIELAASGRDIPTTTQIPIPIPMVPFTGYVEYSRTDDPDTGKPRPPSAELEDHEFRPVTVFPRCQGADCAFWLKKVGICGLVADDETKRAERAFTSPENTQENTV